MPCYLSKTLSYVCLQKLLRLAGLSQQVEVKTKGIPEPPFLVQLPPIRHSSGNAMQHVRDKLQKLRMDANARSALERRVKNYLVEQQGTEQGAQEFFIAIVMSKALFTRSRMLHAAAMHGLLLQNEQMQDCSSQASHPCSVASRADEEPEYCPRQCRSSCTRHQADVA